MILESLLPQKQTNNPQYILKAILSFQDNVLRTVKAIRMPVFAHQISSSTEFKSTATDKNNLH